LVEGRVNGVTRAGLFISIAAYGAEGFLPISLLPKGYWRFDAARQCLTQGSGTGASSLGLGDTLLCQIEEIDMLTGNLILSWAYRQQAAMERGASSTDQDYQADYDGDHRDREDRAGSRFGRGGNDSAGQRPKSRSGSKTLGRR
jgi:hypothetical protein